MKKEEIYGFPRELSEAEKCGDIGETFPPKRTSEEIEEMVEAEKNN